MSENPRKLGNAGGSSNRATLTAGPRLFGSTIWNLVGTAGPVLVGLITIPFIIHGLGTTRFGILTVVWMAIGYFSLFDLGVGLALTKHISELLGSGREHLVPKWVGTGLSLVAILGVLAAGLVWYLAPVLVDHVFKVPAPLRVETLLALQWLSLSLPFVLISTGLIGVLQAYQRFRPIGSARLFLGVFMFVAPLVTMPFSPSVALITILLSAGRVAACAQLLVACAKIAPNFWHSLRPFREPAKDLLSFGGWLTVTNVVGPIMVYFDRFFVGALVSMQAVAYYATPHDMLNRLGMLTNTYMAVLFPAIATVGPNDSGAIQRLVRSGFWFVGLTVAPFAALLVLLAPELLKAWLGADFARQSALAAQLLAAGIFVNSFARIPYTLIQARGRADLTAKTHLLETPFYLVGLWWFVKWGGIEGAALVWLARVAVDTWILFWIAAQLHRLLRTLLYQIVVAATGATCALLVVALFFEHLLWERVGLAIALISVVGYFLAKNASVLLRWRRDARPSNFEI